VTLRLAPNHVIEIRELGSPKQRLDAFLQPKSERDANQGFKRTRANALKSLQAAETDARPGRETLLGKVCGQARLPRPFGNRPADFLGRTV
jgi:hypothetical protein